jgi:hypothetical protein
MSYGGINYDYNYRDSAFNNHDRTSWLRDNFLRPRFDAPLSQKTPAFFNTKGVESSKAEMLMETEAAQLFPRHESSSGRTAFGTIAPSRLRRAHSEEPSLPWAKIARGLPDTELRKPIASPPPDAKPFVADQEGSISRQVASLHGRNVGTFSNSTNFAPW